MNNLHSPPGTCQNVQNEKSFFDTSGASARDDHMKNKVSVTIDNIGLGRA